MSMAMRWRRKLYKHFLRTAPSPTATYYRTTTVPVLFSVYSQ
jgi:hypothetical protein